MWYNIDIGYNSLITAVKYAEVQLHNSSPNHSQQTKKTNTFSVIFPNLKNSCCFFFCTFVLALINF